MILANPRLQRPKALQIPRAVDSVRLIIHGQGVIVFNAATVCSLHFLNANGDAGLEVTFTKDAVRASLLPSGEPLIDPENKQGLSDLSGAYYWVSLDSQNQRLYAGVGEARLETAIYHYQFTNTNAIIKPLFEQFVSVSLNDCVGRTLLRDPITRTVPLAVKDINSLTMDDIATGKYMPKANLTLVSQKLYDCIAGRRFVLNTSDFPDFVKAIEHSIATPGLWCYERLKQKATEFSKDRPNYAETYLRITLGENNGESPGIPYVMEIWPVGHYSPIHNHGGANAVIRVLNGSIHVGLYAFLSGEIRPFAEADFKKEDVTWISTSLNQVHQLKNLDGNKDTCITIQCYMYGQEDTDHYDYFDYIDGNGHIAPYEPDSDMEFMKFKAMMKQEWEKRKRWFRSA